MFARAQVRVEGESEEGKRQRKMINILLWGEIIDDVT